MTRNSAGARRRERWAMNRVTGWATREPGQLHFDHNGPAPGAGGCRGAPLCPMMGGMAERSLGGRLLVATPLLGDPNFRRTVVLIVDDQHGDGTLGVVLNRPTEVPVGQVLKPWTDLVTGPSVVFRGGPVQPDSALALALATGEAEPVGWKSLSVAPVMRRIGLVDLEAPPELLAPGVSSL